MLLRPFMSFGLALFAIVAAIHTLRADDWPQWLGPRADATWTESGIIKAFPKTGPVISWKAEVAGGFSGPAVVKGKVLVSDFVRSEGKVTNDFNARDTNKGTERLLCLDSETGDLLWKYEYPEEYKISYPAGPRCTPTVAGDMVYHLGAEGHLACLSLKDGKPVWKLNLKEAFQSKTPMWGFCSHPVIDGDNLYLIAGPEDGALLCLEAQTGTLRWKTIQSKEPGYAPVVVINHSGKKQIIAWTATSLNSVDPALGKVHWSLPLEPKYGMSIMAPRLSGDLLFASGISNTAMVAKLGADASGNPEASELWRGTTSNAVYCGNSTPFVSGDTIFGCDCNTGAFRAVDLLSGSRLWETFKPTTGKRANHGTAFIVRNADLYYLFSETGHLIIAKLDAKGYKELSRAKVIEPTNSSYNRGIVWVHPAFADKAMFIRNDKEIVRVDLSVKP